MRNTLLNLALGVIALYIFMILFARNRRSDDDDEDEDAQSQDLDAHMNKQNVWPPVKNDRSDETNPHTADISHKTNATDSSPSAPIDMKHENVVPPPPGAAVSFMRSDGGIIDMNDMLVASSNDDDKQGVDMASGWGDMFSEEPKEQLKVQKMLQDTLREGVEIEEDNINDDIPQKVKDAYKAPKAADIRSSAARARELAPEITSRKVDGNIDFAMAYMYKDRAPPTMISDDSDSAQWGVTDAYMYQKSQQVRLG